jgi:hypothetical protein
MLGMSYVLTTPCFCAAVWVSTWWGGSVRRGGVRVHRKHWIAWKNVVRRVVVKVILKILKTENKVAAVYYT